MTPSSVRSAGPADPRVRTIYVVRSGAGSERQIRPGYIALFLLLHLVAGPLMVQMPALAFIHAWGCVLYGLSLAMSRSRPANVAAVAAYMCGSEVLWRMSHAPLFWEFGKYGIILVLSVEMFRRRSQGVYHPALLYFLLLLPSAVLTWGYLGPTQAQKQISFNLSGPLLICVATLYFYNTRVSIERFRSIALALIGPAVGLASDAIFTIMRAKHIDFSDESNPALSGGYGPNQVAAVLGLGAYLVFLIVVYSRIPMKVKLLFGAVFCLLIGQSALTFSRGGLYAAGGALAAAILILSRDAQIRSQITKIGLALTLIMVVFVAPRINSFTGGALSRRFSDTTMTHRGDLTYADLEVWKEHPILGAGPGMAKSVHLSHLAAHTEFSRVLAEHGLFGLFALGALAIMVIDRYRSAPNLRSRALAISALIWSLMFMSANAMRIAAPGFLFGLAFLNIQQGLSGPFIIRRAPREIRT